MREEKSLEVSYVKYMIKGVIMSFILTLIFLFILSIVLVNTSVSENVMTPAIITITAVSILASSSIVTLKINKKGILCGGAIGLCYMLILYCISSLVNLEFGVSLQSIIMFVASIICGCIGGIVGVNMNGV